MNATATHPYNYKAFSFSQKPAEMEHWQRCGVQLGEVAPEFELADIHGRSVRLRDLAGGPVVLEFGSYTCPIFCGRIAAMEQLAQDFPEVQFLVVYIREAHPGEVIGPHRSPADKRRTVRLLLREETIRRRVLIDSVDGGVHRLYGGAWNPVYVLNAAGVIVLRRAWNEPDQVRSTLQDLRSGRNPAAMETTDMGSPVYRRPLGFALLRGGRQALLDFYLSAPPPVREMLRGSATPEVTKIVSRAG